MSTHREYNNNDSHLFPSEGNQSEMNPFEHFHQPNFLDSPLNFSWNHEQDLLPLSLSDPAISEANIQADNRILLDRSDHQQQETRIVQDTNNLQINLSSGSSPKQNLCLLLVRNIRQVVKRHLKENIVISQVARFYLQFVLKSLLPTRKSLKQHIITLDRKDQMEGQFHDFLKDANCIYTEGSLGLLKEGKQYFRGFVCSKEAEMHSERKNEERKQDFLQFVKRTFQGLRKNEMRGKDVKQSRQ